MKIGVEVGKAIIALIPAFLFILASALALVINPIAVTIPSVLMLLLSARLYWFWVPLRIDELSTPSMVATNRATVAERKLRRHSS